MKTIIIALIAIVAVSCTNEVKLITEQGRIYEVNDPDGYTLYADTVVLRFINGDQPRIYSVYTGTIPKSHSYTSYYDSSLVIVNYEKAYFLYYPD